MLRLHHTIDGGDLVFLLPDFPGYTLRGEQGRFNLYYYSALVASGLNLRQAEAAILLHQARQDLPPQESS